MLLITTITLVSVSIMYVLLRVKLRSTRRREAQFARHIAAKAAEIKSLEERLAQPSEPAPAPGVKELKAEVRRATSIRAKVEERMLEQNAEMEALRRQLAGQTTEIAQLRGLVEHVDDV